MAKPLTIIRKIKPGEVNALHDLLAPVGLDIRRNTVVRFPDSPNTHFARFVILSSDLIPAAVDLEPHLMFTSNYDGELLQYSAELERIIPDLDAIFGRVEGYAEYDSFFMFLRDNNLRPDAYYQGFRHDTVAQIRSYARLRQSLENLLDDPRIRDFLNALLTMPRAPEAPPAWYEYPSIALRSMGEALKDAAFAALVPLITNNVFPEPTLTERYSGVHIQAARKPEDLAHVRHLTEFEDLVAQNQMNILSQIKPGQLGVLKRVLSLVNAVAGFTPPGSLAGIQTIHFARWVIFNDGRHMVFESNFDGLWETYIGDFSRDVAGGMHNIWKHTLGFPAGGPKDIVAFEEHIRQHQIRSLAFYSAYPQQTVQNILDDRRVAKAFAALNRPEYQKTLQRL